MTKHNKIKSGFLGALKILSNIMIILAFFDNYEFTTGTECCCNDCYISFKKWLKYRRVSNKTLFSKQYKLKNQIIRR